VVSLSSMPTGGFSPGICSAVAAVARIGGVPATLAGSCRIWEAVMDRWTVTVEEAAQMLGISRSSAYECVRRGELRALRLGRRLVVPRASLEELLGATPAVLPTSTQSEPSC
jgi:excisionase family DNA binding protein